MGIPVFLSYPKPHLSPQAEFIGIISDYLANRGIDVRTLGVTDYDTDAPLKAIRRLMMESNGIITIAFRRLHLANATSRRDADIADVFSTVIEDQWVTSPWCHIEPAMGFQLGLPTLILREEGVIAEGVLENGILGTYMPEFSLDESAEEYLASKEWHSLVGKWEGQVRAVVEAKGNPPKLY